jgi:hypothetical protein
LEGDIVSALLLDLDYNKPERRVNIYFPFVADPDTIFQSYGAGTPRQGGMTDRIKKICAGLRQMKTIMPSAI